MATQQEILEKANEVTTAVVSNSSPVSGGGGLLYPEQANRFLDFIVDQSVLMQNARVVRMRTPQQPVPGSSVPFPHPETSKDAGNHIDTTTPGHSKMLPPTTFSILYDTRGGSRHSQTVRPPNAIPTPLPPTRMGATGTVDQNMH